MSVFGAANTISVASDRTLYGDSLNTRDAPLVNFLETHRATSFYTGYWTCNRLMLATTLRLTCAVVATNDAFGVGFNRYPPATRAVGAAHPAWVFDMRALDADPSVPAQVAACVATRDQRCADYVSTMVNGYLIDYYPSLPG